MKNKFKTLALTLMLSTTAAMADESLVALEGAFGSLNVDQENSVSGATSNSNVSLMGGGIKIGAQSDEFRVFLSANYYDSSDSNYNYVTTYGAELDYLIKPSPSFDIFLGVNAGIASIEQIDDTNVKRTSKDMYYGGSGGLNVHLNNSFDLEFGGRVLLLDISNTKNNVKYTYNTLISGYASVIYKFHMKD
jgi:hypothetical protein